MREALTVRVHALLERSYANGPGCRAVIWVQGCTIRCDGCCNPQAQDPRGGEPVDVSDLLAWIRDIEGIEGITVSGGEPLQQRRALAGLLLEAWKATDLSVVLFTGYDWTHITRTPGFLDVAMLADVVIAGPYRKHQRLERSLRGSANQTIHLLTDKYSLADIEAVPEAEVVIDGQRAVLSGVVDATMR
jgi:anaerobic ribonucleoside-triphosphate reductase activating protein